MMDEYAHTQQRRGQAACQATSRSGVGRVTITVMSSLTGSEGWGQVLMGTPSDLFGVHQKYRDWSTLNSWNKIQARPRISLK